MAKTEDELTTPQTEEPTSKPSEAPSGQKEKEQEKDKEKGEHKRDFSYTQNREISWLRFDSRVLDESFDESVPLFERVKFCSIFDSNLNEWFMIRVGGLSDLSSLKNQPRDNKSNETPAEQLDNIFKALPPLLERYHEAFSLVEGEMQPKGLQRVPLGSYTPDDLAALSKYFDAHLAPIISPMVIDPRHPFPNLRNGRLYVCCTLNGPTESGVLGIIEVPSSEQRVVALPSGSRAFRYTLIEDVIRAFLDRCFGDYVPKKSAVLRVTRNADIDPDGEGVEEEEDYRQHMKKILKMRQRLQPVRLEISGELNHKWESFITEQLGLESRRVFHLDMPLNLGYVYGLEDKIPNWSRSDVIFPPFQPQLSPLVDSRRPMREQVFDHDILLTYPYESMTPLLNLVREASADDDCISIKITLYRVAKRSHLCESLINAAEAGKDVTVLMELRARFDEENNIEWAERLEDAGCTVIYGSEGFKCHSKICQITYHDASGISRITCLGTGNFNEKTAKLYSDFMLLTANTDIAADANVFFRNLSLGNLRGSYKVLGVAPVGLKPLVMKGLDREIGRAQAGQPALVFIKMNSLTDRDVIDKISEACEAGVKVLLIVRGICCIKANVPGKTDGLVVRQIVGRFLEHARIYAFGADTDTLYLSSADMMTRNTERRVEIAYPVFDPTCRKIVNTFVNLQLADNVKARQLTSDGTWEKVERKEGEPEVNSQEVLLALAYARSREGKSAAAKMTPSTTIAPFAPEELSYLAALPKTRNYESEAASRREEKPLEIPESQAPRRARPVERLAQRVATVTNSQRETTSTPPAASAPTAKSTSSQPSQVVPTEKTQVKTAPVASKQEPASNGNRIATAFGLIGRGFRMLFGGDGR
ncbi:MAG: polyphosphate kinase 1 [Tractidigestivibacter sp.]|jgi:polyphosphate kinase|uniref:polyphosphate kinase 1 n=1 Tax=Tractidigestivibacter sp. TaxID=2847320 RepID=UPI003D94C400